MVVNTQMVTNVNEMHFCGAVVNRGDERNEEISTRFII